MTRRNWAKLLLVLPVCLRRSVAGAPGQAFQVDRLMTGAPPENPTSTSRTYRADAVISLLSIPIFNRPAVGHGFAVLREQVKEDCRVVTLQFGAGSVPAQARGLNKLGFMHEVVVDRFSGLPEAAYFGFMTSSPETSFREGKSNLKNRGDMVPYTAVDGYSGSRKAGSTRATILFPSSYTWTDHKTLLQEIRSSFYTVEAGLRESFTATPSPAQASKTFLHTMAGAIRSGQPNMSAAYVYNGKSYKLTLTRVKDRKQGSQFVAKGIAKSPDTIDLLTGQIEEDITKWRAQFKLWVDSSSATPLPLRFEFAPKSFLKLAFEAEPHGKSNSKEIL